MIDLDKFYKFEVGIGIAREHADVKILAYAQLPDGEKVLGSHVLSGVLLEDSHIDEFKIKLNELLVYLMRQVSEEVRLDE